MDTLRPARAGSMHVASWQRQHLGGEDRRRIMEAARRLDRETRRPGQHGGMLKRTGIAVLWTLLYRGWGKNGVCDPALAQLAEWADCSRSTVQEALRRIEETGILWRLRRGLVVRLRGRVQFVQWTNAYLFRAPAAWFSAPWAAGVLVGQAIPNFGESKSLKFRTRGCSLSANPETEFFGRCSAPAEPENA
jgi:DNA-binding MarR family transcriptional regulator